MALELGIEDGMGTMIMYFLLDAHLTLTPY